MSERDFKIEMINGYRKLMELVLKPVTKDANVQSQIQADFQAFVNEQLNDLMGNESEDKLSSEEVSFLKSFISTAQARAKNPVSKTPVIELNKNEGTTNTEAVKTPKQPKREDRPAYVPRNVQPPLGNRNSAPKGGSSGNSNNPNQSILNQLDEMDRKYENEFD